MPWGTVGRLLGRRAASTVSSEKLSDPRQVLGLRAGASLEEVKQAYRQQAKQLHPDRNCSGSTEEFKRLSWAYSVLARERGESASGVAAERWSSAATWRYQAAAYAHSSSMRDDSASVWTFVVPALFCGCTFAFMWTTLSSGTSKQARPNGILEPPVVRHSSEASVLMRHRDNEGIHSPGMDAQNPWLGEDALPERRQYAETTMSKHVRRIRQRLGHQ